MNSTPEESTATFGAEEQAVQRSMNAVRSVVRALRINTRAIESKMGMSLAQLFVLQQLAERSANSLNELAERTATHQSSVSVVVRRLVESGYVSRTTSALDRRRLELLVGAPVTVQTELVNALRSMSEHQQATLADLLEQWLHNASIDIATPPMLGEEEHQGAHR